MLSIALFQPDIPQNLGALMRLAACLDIGLEIIEPCGFVWDDARMKRAGMDYIEHARAVRHASWGLFQASLGARRLILMTTHAPQSYIDFSFKEDDILLAGRESAGAPAEVHEAAAHKIGIPMAAGTRSLNIVNATAMIAGEALRQTRWRTQ